MCTAYNCDKIWIDDMFNFFASYHQFDKMRIALNMDVSLLLSQLVFFIGLPTSATLVSHNMQIDAKNCRENCHAYKLNVTFRTLREKDRSMKDNPSQYWILDSTLWFPDSNR